MSDQFQPKDYGSFVVLSEAIAVQVDGLAKSQKVAPEAILSSFVALKMPGVVRKDLDQASALPFIEKDCQKAWSAHAGNMSFSISTTEAIELKDAYSALLGIKEVRLSHSRLGEEVSVHIDGTMPSAPETWTMIYQEVEPEAGEAESPPPVLVTYLRRVDFEAGVFSCHYIDTEAERLQKYLKVVKTEAEARSLWIDFMKESGYNAQVAETLAYKITLKLGGFQFPEAPVAPAPAPASSSSATRKGKYTMTVQDGVIVVTGDIEGEGTIELARGNKEEVLKTLSEALPARGINYYKSMWTRKKASDGTLPLA